MSNLTHSQVVRTLQQAACGLLAPKVPKISDRAIYGWAEKLF